jgi:hypothetical protein
MFYLLRLLPIDEALREAAVLDQEGAKKIKSASIVWVFLNCTFQLFFRTMAQRRSIPRFMTTTSL